MNLNRNFCLILTENVLRGKIHHLVMKLVHKKDFIDV